MKRRVVYLATVATLGWAALANATPVTLGFSGAFSLSGSSNLFDGTLTWDTTTAPFLSFATEKLYRPSGGSLVLNGTDVTADLELASSFIGVSSNAFAWQFLLLGPPVNGSAEVLTALAGSLTAGVDLFSPTLSLPSDLSFLSLTTPQSSVVLGNGTGTNGSLEVFAPAAAVPEPTSLMLVASGAIGLVVRRRRHAS